jgi:uncharacterized protein YkwD
MRNLSGYVHLSKGIIGWLLVGLLLSNPSFRAAASEPPPTLLNEAPAHDRVILSDSSPVPLSDEPLQLFLPLIRNDLESGRFLNVRDRATALSYYQQTYVQAAQPPINWTGSLKNCVPGTVGEDYQNAVLARINFFRRYAGVPNQISFLEAYNAKAQAAALMMARNNALSHTPPTDWYCYTTLGAQGASSSNLALGVYGWVAIDLYIKDPGDGNGAAGHRRWIFYPQTQNMGNGDIPPQDGFLPANALVVFDSHYSDARPETRDPFVAWPPAGYIPYSLVYPRWSFSLPVADFSNAAVSMQLGGVSVPLIQEAVHNGYGERTLVWIPNGMSSWAYWPRPSEDKLYHVSISNILINGVPTTYQYDVIIIDPAQ